MKKKKIAFLNSHPIQYFAPFYSYLNRDSNLDVVALYLTDYSLRGGRDRRFGRSVKWDIDLLVGYTSKFVGGERAHVRIPHGFFSLCVPELWAEIRSGEYDALVIHGHNYMANIIALIAARSAGIPVMMRCDTHLGLIRNPLKTLLRKPLLYVLYSMCDRCLAIGTANYAFYEAMGVSRNKISLVPFAVDNDRFTVDRFNSDSRSRWRKHFSIPNEGVAILFAAKFTAQKRPMDFLRAVHRVRQISERAFHIILTGSGALEGDLRAYCAKNGLDDVIFTGFVNQTDMPKLYGASDIFVFPSDNEESWGLSVNEAMCAALPIVISREVGCVPDLVTEGVNGYTPRFGDINAFAAALLQLIENDTMRNNQGIASLRRISQWSYRESLQGLLTAIADA